MSKLIENLSDTILSRWDKKHINDKGEKIVTSLLTRFALNKGTYWSNELEFQHQDEHIQFRANKNDTVTLGLLLDHLFDIQEDEISDLYIITENRRGKTGTSITREFEIIFKKVKSRKTSNLQRVATKWSPVKIM